MYSRNYDHHHCNDLFPVLPVSPDTNRLPPTAYSLPGELCVPPPYAGPIHNNSSYGRLASSLENANSEQLYPKYTGYHGPTNEQNISASGSHFDGEYAKGHETRESKGHLYYMSN